jgi:hypothetical protein
LAKGRERAADTVSKRSTLSLLSRVERLEALLSRSSGASVSGASVVDASASASSSSWIQSEKPSEKPVRVVLDEDDSPMVELEFEDEEKKQLTKPVRVVETVASRSASRKRYRKYFQYFLMMI